MNQPRTHTLDVPGAVLTYDIRGNESGTEPVLLLFGSPMGARGFATLAGHFADRTVVTYDPRGAERSKRTDGAPETTPDEHADDLHQLISALEPGRVDMFATSGGAVNALAFLARHPERSESSSPTSRRLHRCCRIAGRFWQRASTSTRRTSVAASGQPWRSSSRSPATKVRSRPTTPSSPHPIPPCSDSRLKTTVPGTTPWSGRTCPRASRTSTSTPSAPRRPASSSPSERRVAGR
jgi:pimeloyl-ACP methyl ester carboxylesterase